MRNLFKTACLFIIFFAISSGGTLDAEPGRAGGATASGMTGRAHADVIVHEFDFSSRSDQGWKPLHNLGSFRFPNGVLATQATGGDAYMMVAGLDLDTSAITHVTFRMKSDQPGNTQVYYATSANPDLAGKPVPAARCVGDGQWHEYSVRLARQPGFEGRLRALRLDPVNSLPGEKARLEFAWIRLIRMAPRVNFLRLSVSKVILRPGQPATLTLEFRNEGGKIEAPLVAELHARTGPPVLGKLSFEPKGSEGRAVWQVEASRPGLQSYTVVLKLGGRNLLRAKLTCLAGSGPELLSQNPLSGPRSTLLQGPSISLQVVPDISGAAGAAILRCLEDGQWKIAGILSPLAQLVTGSSGTIDAEDLTFSVVRKSSKVLHLSGKSTYGKCELSFALTDSSEQIEVHARLVAGLNLPLARFSMPVLRVGFGPEGSRKAGALFPGLEYLGKDDPSSNEEIAGPLHAFRPYPRAHTITVPALAVLKEGVLTGMMWEPLQDWGAGPDAMPAAEFASPNFLDQQSSHRIGCFVPDAPYRSPGESVASSTFLLEKGKSIQLHARLFALPGGKLTDVVPLWYRVFGQPAPAPATRPDEQTLAVLMQGYTKTLWDPDKKGFTTHYRWHHEKHRWIPPFAARVLTYSLRTGDWHWAEAIGLKRGAQLHEVLGSIFRNPRVPPLPGSIDRQAPGGLWPYVEKTRFDVKEYIQGFKDRLGEPGEIYNGYASTKYLVGILNHAVRWGDAKSIQSALKGLKALESFRVPRGAQTWEVPAATPDLLGSSSIANCYLLGYELTGEAHYLEMAGYWLYTGLPFLYAYHVPGTGPGAGAVVNEPKRHTNSASVYYTHPDRLECTPYGSIPVFGTSLYRVSWFGTLVQFCGMLWARSALDYVEFKDDPVLRRAAEGVARIGANLTMDTETYSGLLPDSYNLAANRVQPALIGPMRVEPVLRQLMDRPAFAGLFAKVVHSAGARRHIQSRGLIHEVELAPHSLKWTQRFLPDQVCETLVLPQESIRTLRATGRTLPEVEDLLQAREGWQHFPALRAIGLRIRHRSEYETVELEF